jgi:hypothetical protein
MKPLPNFTDEAAMILRGKRSALAEARRQATEGLRDAYNAAQSADWNDLEQCAQVCGEYSARLATLASMWRSLD